MTDKEWAEARAEYDKYEAAHKRNQRSLRMSDWFYRLLCNPLLYVFIISLLIVM